MRGAKGLRGVHGVQYRTTRDKWEMRFMHARDRYR